MQPYNTWVTMAVLLLAGRLWAAENLIRNESLEDFNQDYPAAPLGFGTHIRQGTNDVDRRYQWVDGGRTYQKAFKSELFGEYAVLRPRLQVEALASNTLYRFSLWYRTKSEAPRGNPQGIFAEPSEAKDAIVPGGKSQGFLAKEGDQPIADVIDLCTGGPDFPYPTAPDWVQAHIFFLGRECRQLKAQMLGFENGRADYKRDAAGQPLKDAKGNLIVLNPARLTAWIDDLELRSATAADYQGNLLENGGFETGRPPHKPPGWRNMYAQDKRPGVLDDQVCRSGKQSLRLDCTNTTVLSANRLPVHPGDIGTFVFWIKSTLASLPLRVDIFTNGKKNNSPYNWVAQKYFTAGTAWRQIQFMVEIPGQDSADYDSDTAVAQPQIRLELPEKITGTVWLDDAEFIIETF